MSVHCTYYSFVVNLAIMNDFDYAEKSDPSTIKMPSGKKPFKLQRVSVRTHHGVLCVNTYVHVCVIDMNRGLLKSEKAWLFPLSSPGADVLETRL